MFKYFLFSNSYCLLFIVEQDRTYSTSRRMDFATILITVLDAPDPEMSYRPARLHWMVVRYGGRCDNPISRVNLIPPLRDYEFGYRTGFPSPTK
jgi:hypothetical protein